MYKQLFAYETDAARWVKISTDPRVGMGYFNDEPQAYYFSSAQEFNSFLEKYERDYIQSPDYYAQVIIKSPCGSNELSCPITEKGHKKLLALIEKSKEKK